MKFKPSKLAPLWIALGVILLVWFLRLCEPDLVERLELLTYDMRVRTALQQHIPASDQLGFVYINEETVRAVQDGSLGFRFGLYWPRQVYARALDELFAQGAHAVALDVIFAELRPDHAPVQMADGTLVDSDVLLATQFQMHSNAILALNGEVAPPPLFLTNAHCLGDISTEKDADGILRRARAFRTYREWHPVFRQLEADPEYGVNLKQVSIEPRRLVLRRSGIADIVVPLAADGTFALADFEGPRAGNARARPFSELRVWHMGIVLAARELGLDLDHAEVDLRKGRIRLAGSGGTIRDIPVDAEGRFFVNWALTPNDPRLEKRPLQELLRDNKLRLEGHPPARPSWQGKLVVVGSSAVMGNDLTDRGATPFAADTLLVSKHWNVANSVLMNRFIHRAPLWMDLLMIGVLAAFAAVVTWSMRAVTALMVVIFIGGVYLVLCTVFFIESRYWLPVILPLLGGALMTHVCLVTWRVVFEQAARRRVAAVLATIVSPKIARELLRAEKLSLGGAHREITVLFADVRGFTELTDASQERAESYVRDHGLTGAEAEACIDAQARETLAAVNLYLGTVADVIVSHDGTLDKFIGDCVMAFWGAPTPIPNHAACCVRAAVDAQRAIEVLNQKRREVNRQIELDNQQRRAAGLEEKELLPILNLGTGINSGMATVGLMGSEVQAVVRQGNYTVFGREVNLASRLESLAGAGRIYISQSTFEQVQRADSDLARLCVALPPVTVKGIRNSVRVYEVQWASKSTNAAPVENVDSPRVG